MHPNAKRWLRILGGSALIVGGLLGFLPVVGFWMLPIGVGILGQEVAWVRRLEDRVTGKLRNLIARFRRQND